MKEKFKGIVISGPTAVGKTSLSIALGKNLKADIISADSSQIYCELNIGTAKIRPEETEGVRHYMIDVKNPGEDYSVGDFEMEVSKILAAKNGKNIIIVGGTGLYIKALTDGFSELPSKNEKLREKLEKKSDDKLRNILKKVDEISFSELDLNNRQRVIRAIEVYILTGKKFSSLKNNNIKNNEYDFLKIFLIRNREELYERINRRVDVMFSEGLLEEAENIYKKYKNSLDNIIAIGYKELFAYFNGKYSLEKAKEMIKRESRRYAKRQITWFRREKEYKVYNLSEISEEDVIKNIMEDFENMR